MGHLRQVSGASSRRTRSSRRRGRAEAGPAPAGRRPPPAARRRRTWSRGRRAREAGLDAAEQQRVRGRGRCRRPGPRRRARRAGRAAAAPPARTPRSRRPGGRPELAGHGVGRRLGEHQRRELGEAGAWAARPGGPPRPGRACVGSPKCAGTAVLQRRARAAAVLAARRGEHRGAPEVVAAAPVAGDVAQRREARLAAVGTDAGAVDRRRRRPRRRPSRGRCRRAAARACRCPPRRAAPSRAARCARRARSTSCGKSTPAIERSAIASSRRRPAPRRAAPRCGRARRPARARAASCPGRARGQHLAVGGDQREVRLGVAAVDGEDDARSRRRHRQQVLQQVVDLLGLADQRVGEQRLAGQHGVAAWSPP